MWNAGGCPGWTQTLSANSTQDFSFVANYPKSSSGAICSYPNEWPHDAQGPIDSYSQTTSTFRESFPHTAQTQAHAMYDLWFDNWAYEVMVQYDFSNDAPCEGSWPEVKTNVTFGGSNGVPTQQWHLCEGNGGKSLIWKLGAADGSQEQSENSGSVDLLPMLKYLESNGYLPGGSTWTAISMGWEIASTGGQNETFSNSEFRVSMISGGEANSGYWLVGSDGGIFNFGSAAFYGSTGSLTLQRPVVGITPTNDNNGYWLVASDGGVFVTAMPPSWDRYRASACIQPVRALPHSLNQPIVGIVPSANGQGYYMVAADGGVFAFNSTFAGSCPGIGGCSGAAVAVAPDASGKGYWLATSTGQIYSFGNAKYFGAPGPQTSPITSMVRTPDGGGYYIIDALGQVFAYGDAVWRGICPLVRLGGSIRRPPSSPRQTVGAIGSPPRSGRSTPSAMHRTTVTCRAPTSTGRSSRRQGSERRIPVHRQVPRHTRVDPGLVPVRAVSSAARHAPVKTGRDCVRLDARGCW